METFFRVLDTLHNIFRSFLYGREVITLSICKQYISNLLSKRLQEIVDL